jgi:hypothetical protein
MMEMDFGLRIEPTVLAEMQETCQHFFINALFFSLFQTFQTRISQMETNHEWARLRQGYGVAGMPPRGRRKKDAKSLESREIRS